MKRAWIAMGLTVALLYPSATSAAEPLPMTAVSPADGASLAIPSSGVPFEMHTSITGLEMNIEVASQNTPGQDGTLANDFHEDFFGAFESDAYPGTYRGTSNFVPSGGWWASRPGVYYWQVEASKIDYPTSEFREYVSSVYRLEIRANAPPQVTPVSPGLSKSEAQREVRPLLRDGSGHRVFGLHRQCDRRDRSSFSCAVRWRSTRRASRRTWIYAGELELEADGQDIVYSFSGSRARYTCLKRKSVRRCARHVRF